MMKANTRHEPYADIEYQRLSLKQKKKLKFLLKI